MSSEKPTRRTQAERSETMRKRILKATIHNLHAHGYAATSTSAVAKEADVSRGAMLHHFPTKVDLMLYVVEAVYDEELEIYRKRLLQTTQADGRRRKLTETVWTVLSRPEGVAILEVLQGSRSDQELAKQLAPLQARIEKDSLQRIQQHQVLPDAAANLAMVRLIVWAMRGLSIAQVLIRKPAEIRQSVDLLSEMIDLYLSVHSAKPVTLGVADSSPAPRRVASRRKA